MSDKKDAKKIVLAYMGVRLSDSNKKRYTYFQLDTGKEWWFQKQLLSIGIGQTMECMANESTIFGDGRKALSPHENDKQVTQWTTDHRTALLNHQAILDSKKEHSASVETVIANLQRVTYGMSRREKTRFAMYVFNKLI